MSHCFCRRKQQADPLPRLLPCALRRAADGTVSYTGMRLLPGPLLDNQWHMATLSSQPAGGKGYRWVPQQQGSAAAARRVLVAPLLLPVLALWVGLCRRSVLHTSSVFGCAGACTALKAVPAWLKSPCLIPNRLA